MKNLTLERKFFKPEYTIGWLFMDGVRYCDTLEDTTRDLNKDGDLNDDGEQKIIGETAIPYGRYHVEVTYSPKFKRLMPLVLDVWGFVGIRIHRGRWPIHTSGCILVGENRIKGGLINSALYEKHITAILHTHQRMGEKIYLNVI